MLHQHAEHVGSTIFVRAAVLLALSGVIVLGAEQFSFQARGRTYTVRTNAISGSGFTFAGHGMMQPSVVLPSAVTQNYYMMLFNSNKIAYQDGRSGQAIFITYSPNGYSAWMTPEPLLDNTGVDNICDMAVSRPIYDGSQWRVYVQALEGDYRTQSCTGPGVVFMAVGSLCHGCLAWVKEPGTNHAKKIAVGTAVGIGEDLQWFYTAPYGGAAQWPIMWTYNDWGYGADVFSYLWTQDMNTSGYWYGPASPAVLSRSGFDLDVMFPDAMLLGSMDESTYGPPGFGLQSACATNDHRYQYGIGIGYFPNPQSNTASAGIAVAGPLSSTSSDGNGPRMFRPRLARNEHGYIPVWYSGPISRSWMTYLYYNDTQINDGSADACHGYGRWHESDQRFRVSEVIILEE